MAVLRYSGRSQEFQIKAIHAVLRDLDECPMFTQIMDLWHREFKV